MRHFWGERPAETPPVRIEKDFETDTTYKAPDFIHTYTGGRFFPLHPNAADISIIDIAHHLAQQCRYSGATRFFYPTAQHCVLLATYAGKILKASPVDCLQILMHDAAEAYMLDMPRPIKQFFRDYRAREHAIQAVVREWLGLADTPLPEFQDDIDSRIVVDERDQVMHDPLHNWELAGVEPLGVQIEPWSITYSEQQFLLYYAAYMHKISGTHHYLRSDWSVPIDKVRYWRTQGGDVPVRGADDERVGWSPDNLAADLLEVDLRGGVARVRLRDDRGRMVRDPEGGAYPRAASKWVHGKFTLESPHVI